MQPSVGKTIYALADSLSKELNSEEILTSFKEHFVNKSSPLCLLNYSLTPHPDKQDSVCCHASLMLFEKKYQVNGEGNGPISALVNALDQAGLKHFNLVDYYSHAIAKGSDADSAAYIQLRSMDNKQSIAWGCGVDSSIQKAGLKALVSASNLLYSLHPSSFPHYA